MNDERQRARVIATVRTECLPITCELEQMLRAMRQSNDPVAPIADMFLNHRISQIATSVAWHETRRDPASRLQELARELARLWQKAGKNSPEAVFYVALVIRLDLSHELARASETLQHQIKTIQYTIDEERDEKQRRELARRERGRLQQYRAEKQVYEDVIDAVKRLAGQTVPASGEMPYALPREPWTPPPPDGDMTPAEYEHWKPLMRLLLALAVVQSLQTLLRSVDLRWQIIQKGGTLCP